MIDSPGGTTTTERTGYTEPRFDYPERERTDRSIASLLRKLSSQSSTLVRDEVALARAEFGDKLDTYRSGLLRLAIGTGLLIAGVLLLMAAVNRGLTTILTDPLGLDIAVWLSPLILGVVVSIVAWALFKSAMNAMKREGVVPHETVATLREDKDWAERRVRA